MSGDERMGWGAYLNKLGKVRLGKQKKKLKKWSPGAPNPFVDLFWTKIWKNGFWKNGFWKNGFWKNGFRKNDLPRFKNDTKAKKQFFVSFWNSQDSLPQPYKRLAKFSQ